MAKATSTSESSLSSILANALVSVSGVNGYVASKHTRPGMRQRLAQVFTNRIRKEARSPKLWGKSADTLNVTIGDDDRVEVGLSGTPDEVATAEMLEYGTPGNPPRAVMRTYEAMFNEEYKVLKDRGMA